MDILKNKKVLVFLFLFLLIAVAAFLRFYRIADFIIFLGDQGRDAIVMRRIITGEDFPGIGPRSSVGELFLGPFFFYLMAPFLGLFQFDPVGPAFGIALLWTMGLIGAWFVLRKEFSTATAFLFLLATTFSYALVSLGRFSWNPNLLPIFAFFSLYLYYKMLVTKKIWIGVLAGICFGAALQLHYLFLLVIPAYLGMTFMVFRKDRKKLQLFTKPFLSFLAGAVFIFLPFIAFEIKNNFLNLKGIFSIFEAKQFEGESTFLSKTLDTHTAFWEHIVQLDLPHYLGIILSLIFIGICAYTWKKTKEKKNSIFFAGLFFSFLSYLFVFSLVDTQRFLHYYTPLYAIFYALLAIIPLYLRSKAAMIALLVLIVAISALNTPKYRFFVDEGNNQTKRAESIAREVNKLSNKKPYYLVSIPLSSTNHHIRYFLEVMGNRPLPEESTEYADELFILCTYENTALCKPTDDAQYQVAIFDDKVVVNEVSHPPEVTIYHIVHGEQN